MRAEETVFRTIVEVPKWKSPMHLNQHFMLLGSCFAEGIGERFESYGLQAVSNPFGVLYNPDSIAVQVKYALQGNDKLPVFKTNGEWRCWLTNTFFSGADEKIFRKSLDEKFRDFGEQLRRTDILFITLGTNVCYRLCENGMTVTNCQKQPASLFEEVTLSPEACVHVLDTLMLLLRKECPKLQVIFTVSPFRYRKYGFHGSQLSKATLLLAVDDICKRYADTATYFPAYELILDELRDYRFYADDMIHPSSAAVDYIWRRLVENCMDEEMQHYLVKYEPIRKANAHRSLASQKGS